jgi:hypothetical protein
MKGKKMKGLVQKIDQENIWHCASMKQTPEALIGKTESSSRYQIGESPRRKQ